MKVHEILKLIPSRCNVECFYVTDKKYKDLSLVDAKDFDVKAITGLDDGGIKIEVYEGEVEYLSPVLVFKVKHQYGKVKFVDKDNELIQVTDIDDLVKISTNFYDELVEYKQLLPTDNPYKDEIVACIKFVDHTKEELKDIRDK